MDDSQRCLNNIYDCGFYWWCREQEDGNKNESIESAAEKYRIDISDATRYYNHGMKLFPFESGNPPMVGININLFWDFYNNTKTEFEKASLLGFLGIKSILGNKPYCKITLKYWLSRMAGYPNIPDQVFLKLPKELKKYEKRYQYTKLKNELQHNWNLIEYGLYTRGFYVSFVLSQEELILKAEQNRKSNKNIALQQAKKSARIEAIQQIKNGIQQ
jgi:hypothetical protein